MAELKTIDDLKPDPGNPRSIEEPAAMGLRMSMQSFGDVGGVTWNKQTGELVSGHQRVEQLRRAGAQLEPGDPPHLVLGDYRWPVRVVDWSRERQRTANLAANNPHTAGDFTPDVGEILAELEGQIDEDMFAGLRLGEIEILEMKHVEFDALVDQDDVPEPPTESVTRLGDVWTLGRHRLVCGDATWPEVVAELLNGEKAGSVFTDPPYGMDLDTDFSGMEGMAKGNIYERVIGDDRPYDPAHIFRDFGYVKEIFLWGADYYAERIPDRLKGSWFVWDKAGSEDAPKDAYDKMFGSNFELCWSRTRHKRALVRILWKGIFGLGPEDTNRRVHPTQKPARLAAWFIEKFHREGPVVDLFLGSGTTLIAAEQLDRICFGVEISPAYVDVCVERWQNLIGGKAKRSSG